MNSDWVHRIQRDEAVGDSERIFRFSAWALFILLLFVQRFPFSAPHSLFLPLLCLSVLMLFFCYRCGRSLKPKIWEIFFFAFGLWGLWVSQRGSYDKVFFDFYFLSILFLYTRFGTGSFRFFEWTFLSLAAVIILYGVYQIYFIFPELREHLSSLKINFQTQQAYLFMIGRIDQGRAMGIFANPSTFGAISVAGWVTSVDLFYQERAWKKNLAGALSLWMLAGVYWGRSVGSLLLLAIVSWIYLRKNKALRKYFFPLLIILLIFSSLIIVFRFREIFTDQNNVILLRLSNWWTALLLFWQRPVEGVGVGGFAIWMEHFRPVWGNWTAHAHNFFLEALAERGLVGASLLLSAVGTYFWKLWPRPHGAIFMISILFLFHNAWDVSYFEPGAALIWAAWMGMAVGVESKVEG